MLCALFVHAMFTQVELAEKLVRSASLRQFALAVSLVVELALMVALSVAELPVFGLMSQILFFGVGIISVEALICISLGLMVLNSWWTSHQMVVRSENFRALVKEEEERVPLQYQI